MSQATNLIKIISIVFLLVAQSSCYQGKLDPFDVQNGLSRKDIKDAIVKQPEGINKKNSELLKTISIPKTSKLIMTPPPPVIGGDKVISFSVTDTVPLKDVLTELGRVAKIDVDISSKVSGGVTINAKNRSLKEILDRISTQANLRYSYNNGVLYFEPDAPIMKNYFVDYLQKGPLWGEVEKNILSILTNSQDSSGVLKNSSISSNKSAGIITAFATESQQEEIAKYLDAVYRTASAQVLIEAKIVEVGLKEEFRAGIQWDILGTTTSTIAGTTSGGGGIVSGTISLFNGNISSSINALETFGTTRTIASPRLHAINNQKASLKFADTIVYFKIDSNQNVTTTSGATSANQSNVTSTKEELDIGTELEISPSINIATQEIVLNVKPTLSVRGVDVIDPASPTNADGESVESLQNKVPQVNTRTVETIAKIKSGDVLVIGGLMRDDTTNTDTGVPFLAGIPVLGWLFKSSTKETNITETVIFIKATIIENGKGPSKIDADLQKKFDSNRRRFFDKR